MAAPQTVRRWILTGSVTAITITGALYGAGLKSSQEKAQIKNRSMALSADEKIAQYQSLIEEWERTKKELERKLDNFQAKKRGQYTGEEHAHNLPRMLYIAEASPGRGLEEYLKFGNTTLS